MLFKKEGDLGLLLEDEHIDFVEALQHLEGTKAKEVNYKNNENKLNNLGKSFDNGRKEETLNKRDSQDFTCLRLS